MRNEEKVAQEKIRNVFEIDYHDLQVLFLLDSCTDKTKDILVREIEEANNSGKSIQVLEYHGDNGKNGAINSILHRLSTDLVVFSDANSMYESDAIKSLALSFCEDESVGVVSGKEVRVNAGTEFSKNEALFWSVENPIKEFESKFNRAFSANGAMFAVRRTLLEEIPPSVPNDFYLPLLVIKKGYKSLYCQQAKCYERASASKREEYGRKKRIVNRAFGTFLQFVLKLDTLTIFLLLSHKVFRWFGVFIFLLFFIFGCWCSYLYSPLLFFGSLFIVGLFFVVASFFSPARKIRMIFIHFLYMHVAAADGIFSRLCGNQISQWK